MEVTTLDNVEPRGLSKKKAVVATMEEVVTSIGDFGEKRHRIDAGQGGHQLPAMSADQFKARTMKRKNVNLLSQT